MQSINPLSVKIRWNQTTTGSPLFPGLAVSNGITIAGELLSLLTPDILCSSQHDLLNPLCSV